MSINFSLSLCTCPCDLVGSLTISLGGGGCGEGDGRRTPLLRFDFETKRLAQHRAPLLIRALPDPPPRLTERGAICETFIFIRYRGVWQTIARFFHRGPLARFLRGQAPSVGTYSSLARRAPRMIHVTWAEASLVSGAPLLTMILYSGPLLSIPLSPPCPPFLPLSLPGGVHGLVLLTAGVCEGPIPAGPGSSAPPHHCLPYRLLRRPRRTPVARLGGIRSLLCASRAHACRRSDLSRLATHPRSRWGCKSHGHRPPVGIYATPAGPARRQHFARSCRPLRSRPRPSKFVPLRTPRPAPAPPGAAPPWPRRPHQVRCRRGPRPHQGACCLAPRRAASACLVRRAIAWYPPRAFPKSVSSTTNNFRSIFRREAFQNLWTERKTHRSIVCGEDSHTLCHVLLSPHTQLGGRARSLRCARGLAHHDHIVCVVWGCLSWGR